MVISRSRIVRIGWIGLTKELKKESRIPTAEFEI